MNNDDSPADDPLEAQQLLVESSLELVFSTLDDAIEAGLVSPIIVLVDCEDEIGSQIARGWLGDEVVDDAVADQAAEQAAGSDDDLTDDGAVLTTVFARAVGWSDAYHLADAFPYLASVFAEGPPQGGVMVVGVTAGGASALTAPWDARP